MTNRNLMGIDEVYTETLLENEEIKLTSSEEKTSKKILPKKNMQETALNVSSKKFYSELYDYFKENPEETKPGLFKQKYINAFKSSKNKEEFLHELLQMGELSESEKKESLNEKFHKRTKYISGSVIQDAMSVAGGMYRMNAKSSVGYAFASNRRGTGVGRGEFRYYQEEYPSVDEFDGYIDFETKILHDLKSGEKIKLEDDVNESKVNENFPPQEKEGNFIVFSFTANGNLKITLTPEGIEKAESESLSELNFDEYVEDITTNSDYDYVWNVGEIGLGLTDAPGILFAYDIADDGDYLETEDSELFYYEPYQLHDFGEMLKKNGYVVFDKANKTVNESNAGEYTISYRINKNNKNYDRLVRVVGNDKGMKNTDFRHLMSHMRFFALHDIVASAYIKDRNKKLQKIYDVKSGKIHRIFKQIDGDKSDINESDANEAMNPRTDVIYPVKSKDRKGFNKEKMIYLFRAGKSVEDLAEIFNLPIQVIVNRLKNYGMFKLERGIEKERKQLMKGQEDGAGYEYKKYLKRTNESEKGVTHDTYFINAGGIKKRLYVWKNKKGTYDIGVNGTSLHLGNIKIDDLYSEKNKMLELAKEDNF